MLFKAESVRNPRVWRKGDWKNVSDVGIAAAESAGWFDHRPPPGEIELVKLAEFGGSHWTSNDEQH